MDEAKDEELAGGIDVEVDGPTEPAGPPEIRILAGVSTEEGGRVIVVSKVPTPLLS